MRSSSIERSSELAKARAQFPTSGDARQLVPCGLEIPPRCGPILPVARLPRPRSSHFGRGRIVYRRAIPRRAGGDHDRHNRKWRTSKKGNAALEANELSVDEMARLGTQSRESLKAVQESWAPLDADHVREALHSFL